MEGKPEDIPPALLNQPVLSQFEQPYYDAFTTLSGSRAWTAGGPAPIPLSEILAYFDMYEITDPDERDDYITMIRYLDAHYIDGAIKKIGTK